MAQQTNWSSIEVFEEERIVGHPDSGEGLSMKIQGTGVETVLGSVRKMNVGSNVVVLDGKRCHVRNKETSQKTRIDYEAGQRVL